MKFPEILYLCTVTLYLILFLLFLRYFTWRWYAYKHFWKRKPHLDQQQLLQLTNSKKSHIPVISILVPARDEADVIGNTLEHLITLDYPPDKYEIVIITDEKEIRGKTKSKQGSTQQVVDQKIKELSVRQEIPAIRHMIVPYDFDGRLPGRCLGKEVPSTKGRALNWALRSIGIQIDLCAFYDAESRPDNKTLLHVAYEWLNYYPQVRLWQGPVFQIRNFYQLGPINKIAAIYQALAHEWYLPVLMRTLPFVGGTNFVIDNKLLQKIGGFDHQALTEDLELGVRAYLEAGAWPRYLASPSSEQTPPTYLAYFRQRLRWGSGHLQVLEKFRKTTDKYPAEVLKPILKALFWKGQAEWLIYQFAILIPVITLPFLVFGQLDPSILPDRFREMLRWLAPLYFLFTFYLLVHFYRYVEKASRFSWKQLFSICQLLVLPLAGFLLPLPYSCAVILKVLHRQPKVWIKTPRTKEQPLRTKEQPLLLRQAKP
ncbi:MAG: glycosyltransferase family 2 protein [Bacillota bacterium]